MKNNRLRVLAVLIPEGQVIELPSSASQIETVTVTWVTGDEHGNPRHLMTHVSASGLAAFVRDLTPGWIEEQP